ncbi:hypothetical protein [Streptomyces broussonetiae]|uniref:Uncharacterized protein n=1 Tax=Streptomyces broussonetiae TaxID=2686304 RepID=A0ABV5EAI7_9ACTN
MRLESLRDESIKAECNRGCLMGYLAVEVADHGDAVCATVHDSFQAWTDALAFVLHGCPRSAAALSRSAAAEAAMERALQRAPGGRSCRASPP